jgi:hypothetical protein
MRKIEEKRRNPIDATFFIHPQKLLSIPFHLG